MAGKEQRRRERFEKLAWMRHIERRTVKECAETLAVSERTIHYYLTDPEFEAVVTDLRTQWKEGAITTVGSLAQTALKTMEELMLYDKSGHVRFEAAKAIGDWLGLGQQLQEAQQDDREEAERLLRILAERPQTINNQIYLTPPEAGGFLPKALQRVVDEAQPDKLPLDIPEA